MESRNWVLARAHCTEERIVESIANALQTDIIAFNDLYKGLRHHRKFVLKDTNGGAPYRIYRAQGALGALFMNSNFENDYVELYLSPAGIGACRKDHWGISIRPLWNQRTLTCDLFIEEDNFPSSLSQISQRILGDFFFGR